MAEVIASAGWRRALFLIKIRKGLFVVQPRGSLRKIAIVRSEGMLCAAVFNEIGLLYRSSAASGGAQRRVQAIL